MNQRSRNIIILTQPLGKNYGGIMQAWSLQRIVLARGYDVRTNNVQARLVPAALKYAAIVKGFIVRDLMCIGKGVHPCTRMETDIHIEMRAFVEDEISTTDVHDINNESTPIDCFIVGSDQVWRKAYSDIRMHLLDFTAGMNVKRVAYAASFGLDNINEYDEQLKRDAAKLAKKFDAISVRESSGVDICRDEWGVDAVQVLDPTLLLDADHYRGLINKRAGATKPKSKTGGVFYYLLDFESDKQKIVNKVADALGAKTYGIVTDLPKSYLDYYRNKEKYVLPAVEEWLDGFNRADFVMTDSFHGMVFSIIFNKPFVVIGNASRGMARFTSLLSLLNLEDRLVVSADELARNHILKPINWDKVNKRLKIEQEKSRAFLLKSLGMGDV